MSREEQEALVAGYALGALSDAENEEAQRLLDAEPGLREIYEDALETALLLAIATSDGEPGPAADLRARIVDAARREEPE